MRRFIILGSVLMCLSIGFVFPILESTAGVCSQVPDTCSVRSCPGSTAQFTDAVWEDERASPGSGDTGQKQSSDTFNGGFFNSQVAGVCTYINDACAALEDCDDDPGE